MNDKKEFRRLRPHLLDLAERWKGATAVPHPPPGEGRVAKMDSNENPYPPDLLDSVALQDLEINRYPDSEMGDLRARIGAFAGADPERIVVGNGGDELIDLLIRLTVEPGEAIVHCPPTFVMFRRFAEVHGATVMDAPLDRDYQVDLDKVRRTIEESPVPVRILFLCNPNNPTGTTVPDAVLESFLDLPVWIVVDEIYYGFCDKTLLEWTEKSDRVIVLRSFSKAYGLAGLRIGYGVFPSDLAQTMRMVRPPYSVNRMAQEMARRVLENTERLKARFTEILGARDRIAATLEACPHLRVVPSDSNYLFCETTTAFRSRLEQELENARVSVRFLASPYSEAAFRVSVGTPEENDRFLEAVEKASA
jgi:histidinol-phosphate aminotransferase